MFEFDHVFNFGLRKKWRKFAKLR